MATTATGYVKNAEGAWERRIGPVGLHLRFHCIEYVYDANVIARAHELGSYTDNARFSLQRGRNPVQVDRKN